MNIVEFLDQVDEAMKDLTGGEVKDLVRRLAVQVPASERQNFLTSYLSKQPAENPELPQSTFPYLENQLLRIEEGQVTIESELNASYDSWHDDWDEDFDFSNYDEVKEILQEALQFIDLGVKSGNYDEAYKIATCVYDLSIQVDGDYDDYSYDGSFTLESMIDYELLTYDYSRFLANFFYLTYRHYGLEERSEALYTLLQRHEAKKYSLDRLLQAGAVVEDLQNFLAVWVEYLGNQRQKYATELLQEALTLWKTDVDRFEVIKRYWEHHSALLYWYFQKQLDSEPAELLLKKGDEVLDLLPLDNLYRGHIGAILAKLTENIEQQYSYLVAAFLSNSSVENLFYILSHPHVDLFLIKEHIQSLPTGELYFYQVAPSSNVVSQDTHSILRILTGDWEEVFMEQVLVRDSLGWSNHFTKTGLSLYLPLLLETDSLPQANRQLMDILASYHNFSYMKDGNQLWNFLLEWRKSYLISTEKKEEMLQAMEGMMHRRVVAIMKGNYRSYYEECARYIAAIGEVRESLGQAGAKQALLLSYKQEYPRRVNFVRDLRSFGLKG